MKTMKRLIAVLLAAVLLICFTSALASAPGSPSDPLISLAYIKDTFYPALKSDIENLIGSTIGALYDTAGKKADQIYGDAMRLLGGMEGYSFAGSFTAYSIPSGKTAELVTGSSFILASGEAALQITRGAVINVSTGEEVPSGAALAVNQRYLCAEDTTAVFSSPTVAYCLIDGYYKTTGSPIVNPFRDVGMSDWFFPAVNYAGEKGLFTGTTPTTFSPQAPMTRAMFVTVLHRLAGKPAVPAATVFSDVANPAEYYYDAVNWANLNKIVTGFDDGKFHPDELITREQMAVIMHRYASYAGYSTIPTDTAAFEQFPDKGSVSDFAVDAMKWAVSQRLINGSDGYLLPKNTATRAQVAQIIMNFSRNIIITM